MIVCKKCKCEKSEYEFSWNNKLYKRYMRWCKVCVRQYDKQRWQSIEYKKKKKQQQIVRRKKNRLIICEYLKNKQCIDCSENRIPTLQFDHKFNKCYNVSDMLTHGNGINTILKEIQKCNIRCANCHALKTAIEQGWYI